MSWWNAVSTCWPPGQGDCVVWWDAWAAVGTIGAAVIALWFGLAPVRGHRRRAKVVGKIAGIRLGIQMLHLGASCELAARIVNASDYNACRINAEHCDSRPLMELVPFFDVMPKKLSAAIADCIADIDTLHALLAKGSYLLPGSPAPSVDVGGMLQGLFQKMRETHGALAKWVGMPAGNWIAAIKEMGESLARVAQLAEIAKWSEQDMRGHILGRRAGQ